MERIGTHGPRPSAEPRSARAFTLCHRLRQHSARAQCWIEPRRRPGNRPGGAHLHLCRSRAPDPAAAARAPGLGPFPLSPPTGHRPGSQHRPPRIRYFEHRGRGLVAAGPHPGPAQAGALAQPVLPGAPDRSAASDAARPHHPTRAHGLSRARPSRRPESWRRTRPPCWHRSNVARGPGPRSAKAWAGSRRKPIWNP